MLQPVKARHIRSTVREPRLGDYFTVDTRIVEFVDPNGNKREDKRTSVLRFPPVQDTETRSLWRELLHLKSKTATEQGAGPYVAFDRISLLDKTSAFMTSPTGPGVGFVAYNKELQKFRKSMLKAHNHYRQLHGVKNLYLCKEMNRTAQSWADHLAQENATLSNSPRVFKGNRLGESIASRFSWETCIFTAEEIVACWYYNGAENYNYEEEPTSLVKIGNFSQIVWRNSSQLGVGRSCVFSHTLTDDHNSSCSSSMSPMSSTGQRIITVCQYYPPGNVIHCFKDNVLAPKTTRSSNK